MEEQEVSEKGEASSGGIRLPSATTGAEEGGQDGWGVVKRAGRGKKTRRPKHSTSRDDEDEMYFSPLDSSPELFFIGLLFVLVASIWTRLHRIAEPDHVA